ncbi:MAG: recombinase family protein [Fimbriimonadaceae bacterium]|nr:recombinase family protein [Fimbriimonadaceae bacterium]
MSDKILPQHQDRTAYVYVRQSSNQQVRDHREGRERQYALADLARRLGFRQVTTIDDDLGRSGSGLQERPGFARLLTAVCQGDAGAVLALEASRLARNNRDWHHLVDLCGLTATLIIDEDGVYDPRLLNDRLLLGLKGSLAEFELGLLRQRARACFEQKVGRGHILWEPAVGFIRTEDHRIEKIADRQVQEALTGVFRKFRELGSARQTGLWYSQEGLRLPEVIPGTGGREIEWHLPGRHRILQILKNPCYAGAFAWGRTQTRTVVENGRAHRKGRRKCPQEKWKVLILDHHPGYIRWTEFLENQRIMETNRNMPNGSTPGTAKTGPALLSGLLRCGRCGRMMFTTYGGAKGNVPRYLCRGDRTQPRGSPCQTVGGLRVDLAVAQAVLDAIQPAGIRAALQAMGQVLHDDTERRRLLELALEKAKYEARRAQRQFDAVDPDNRLVAGELEARWNTSLQEVSQLEDRLKTLGSLMTTITERDQQRLLELGTYLPKLWNHPTTTSETKKRIIRSVLQEIVLTSSAEPPRHELRLHWKGGVHTELFVGRNQRGKHGRATDQSICELVTELSKVCDDRAIAVVLNRLGYRTGHNNSWVVARVTQLRCHYQLPNYQKNDQWLTLQQAAESLGVSHTVVQRLIRHGQLPARQVVKYAPWIINRKDLDDDTVQSTVRSIRAGHRSPPTDPRQPQLPFN